MWTSLAFVSCLAGIASAQSSSATTPAPTVTQPTVSAVIPSPTASLEATVPSQVPLPPKQAWCPSEIFCAGSLLQTVNVADLYVDQKTFVDKPTSKAEREVLASFANITSTNGTTIGQIVDFVNTNFREEGRELLALPLANFTENPKFLNNVSDPLVKAFAQTVHGFWTQLIRGTNESTLCDGIECESSLIPLNHTFVVPGGRFREQYYWDSFWIVEGLIESQLFDIVNGTLQNFLDELETIGFIPNGGRIYYLNRSQPPLFVQMLARYVEASGDRSILRRALPLAEKELAWFRKNRSLNLTSPFTNDTHLVYRYAVNNTAPRPESYLTDYETANAPEVNPPLNESSRSALYAELASGAESGWDYTARWLDSGSADLKTLNVRSTIAVDLNSILYKNHLLLAELYGTSNRTAARRHREEAANLKAAILDLFWDPTKLSFYDFSLKTNARNEIYTVANFYPYWSGIIPAEVLNSTANAFGAFSTVNLVLNRYNGTYPTTFIDTGLQWDAPNAWPPHNYIVLAALRALPKNITSGPLPTSNGSTYDLIPAGQLGLTEAQLPVQPIGASANASTSGAAADINKLNGTVSHGGNATEGEGWADTLGRQLANRYTASALCSWYATGGSIPNVLPRLSDAELNVTLSVNNNGNMFEKFSNLDIDSAGRGGEYTVQAGFGWTNGVLLWVASTYGDVLVAPQCPSLLEAPAAGGGDNNGGDDDGDDDGDDAPNSGFRTWGSSSLWLTVLVAGVASTMAL